MHTFQIDNNNKLQFLITKKKNRWFGQIVSIKWRKQNTIKNVNENEKKWAEWNIKYRRAGTFLPEFLVETHAQFFTVS